MKSPPGGFPHSAVAREIRETSAPFRFRTSIEMKIVSVGRPTPVSKTISPRLRSQLVYFAASPQGQDVPPLGENEYFFRLGETQKVLEDGVIELISPLDTANMTEVEITEEQEEFLEWLAAHELEHVRLVD